MVICERPNFLVARALSVMAVRTGIVGAVVDYGTRHGQDLLSPRLAVSRLLPAAAVYIMSVVCRMGSRAPYIANSGNYRVRKVFLQTVLPFLGR